MIIDNDRMNENNDENMQDELITLQEDIQDDMQDDMQDNVQDSVQINMKGNLGENLNENIDSNKNVNNVLDHTFKEEDGTTFKVETNDDVNHAMKDLIEDKSDPESASNIFDSNNNNVLINEDESIKDEVLEQVEEGDALGMDEEIDHIITEEQMKEFTSHLKAPVPISSKLSSIYAQRQIKRKRLQGDVKGVSHVDSDSIVPPFSSNPITTGENLPPNKTASASLPITNNKEQEILINTWLPFIDILVSSRHEVFSLIHKKLLKHLEMIVSDGPLFKVKKNVLGTSGIDTSLNTSGITSSASKARPKVSDEQLYNLFEYLLPYFHNKNLKAIWRIVLLEMKKRDIIIPVPIFKKLNVATSMWNESFNLDILSDVTSSESTLINQLQDIAIRSYFWRMQPRLFIDFLHRDGNLFNLTVLCNSVDHIVLYNYLLDEWRKSFEKWPESRNRISMLRRTFCNMITEINTQSPFAKSIKETIERFDPIIPLIKIIDGWIIQHDSMVIEFKNRDFNRLITILRRISQYFETVSKRRKIWKDISIVLSDSTLENIVLHDLFTYILYFYGGNDSKLGAIATKWRGRNEQAQKSNNAQPSKSFLILLHEQPKFTTTPLTVIRDHHEQAMGILSQILLLGESTLPMLRNECPRGAPIIYQSLLSDAFPYISKLLTASIKEEPSSKTEDEIDQAMELRSNRKVGSLFSDPLLRKLILKLCIQLFQDKEFEKFQHMVKFLFNQDLSFQERVMNEEFHIFTKPLLESCIQHWHFTRDSEHTDEQLDIVIMDNFIKPIIFPFIRKLVTPFGERTPSEESQSTSGVDHVFKEDEAWLLSRYINLIESFIGYVKENHLSHIKSYAMILQEIATFMNGLLSGGLERLFYNAGWKDKNHIIMELKKHVLKIHV